ncbi:TonB-dependent receptor-like protein [Aquimarina sp. MAR_2010_214]|uniref:TonB-dependent receptor n=1 Tax=Aquimarina sp. MAR_2010_214 TaxID=1250026 RepID=UPI000CAE6F07|nr:TonB-dependent receptor [Aquimarina sp. MAR_2010_214]PKV51801.1 TonB-dependent receptor-like protein [Aquimarina sp. MAR_2010_214]
MKTKQVILAFWVVLMGFSKIFSQQKTSEKYTISGYVKESGSQEYLPGVSIYIPGSTVGTTTNDYGFFSLTIPGGTHELIVSYIGYGTIKQSIDLNNDLTLNFDMELEAESLDEVIIDGDRRANESQVTQMSVVSIKPSEIEDIPAILGEKDVIKALQLLPGIQRGNEGSAGFFVRGGTPDQNLIILDEAPVYNSNHLFGIFSVFNGDAIKSIETYKGGFPARFGGRLSSVLKIDTKNGNKERLSGKINVGLISSSLLVEGPINKGKTSFIFSGRRTYADLLSKPFQTSNFKLGYYFMDLNFKIHHVFNEKNKLYWSNYFGQDKFKAVNKEERNDSETKLFWGNITSTLRWNHQFSDKFFSNTSLIFSNYNFGIKFDEKFNNEIFKFKTDSGINDYGIKADFDYYPSPRHSIKFGLASTYHNFVPKQSRIRQTGVNNSDITQKIESLESALYLEDDWKITNSLSFSPGLRLTHFQFKSTDYLNLEPRATIAWNVKPDLALKASYSKMNQYIHLLSNSGIGLPTDLWVSSTDKLKPQVSEQYALGVAKDFMDDGYSITVEGYYKKMDDVIAYKEGASFLLLEDLGTGKEIDWEDNITTGQGWAYGTEILLRKKTGKLTGWLGYTLSWSERQFEELNQGRKFFSKYDRRHDLSLVGIYKPNDRITLSGTWLFSSGNNFNLPDTESLSNTSNFPITIPDLSSGGTPFSTERNNFRGENYHRLDLGIQFHKRFSKNRERTWGFSIYNIYGKKNPFYYYFEDTKLKKVSILQFVPSINYTYKF